MTVQTLETMEKEAKTDPTDSNIHPFLVDLMGRINMEPTFATERGLLYSFRPSERIEPDPVMQGTKKDFEYEVLIKPETITYREIEHTTGYNFKSKEPKVYHNWKTRRAVYMSLKHEKFGHRVLRIYEQLGRTKKFRGSFTNATAKLAGTFEADTTEADLKNLSVFDPKTIIGISGYRQKRSQLFADWALFQLLQELDPTSRALEAKNSAQYAAYPMLQLFPKSELNMRLIRASLPKNFSLHDEPDAKKFISKVFGTDGVRKDMVKATVGTEDINSLFLAARLKELYPLDWLRDLVANPNEHLIYDHRVIYSIENTEGLVALLSPLSVPQRKRLLVEKVNSSTDKILGLRLVRDSIQMMSQLNPEQREQGRFDYTSWKTFHDTIVEVFNEIKDAEELKNGSAKLDWEGTYMERLNDRAYVLEGEAYTLKAPTHKNQLKKWGNEMHNCIGSYFHQVQAKRTNVFGVYADDGTLFGNIEIANQGWISQYMNKYNRPAPEPHITSLTMLVEAEAIEHQEKLAQEAKRRKEEDRIKKAQDNHSKRQTAMTVGN